MEEEQRRDGVDLIPEESGSSSEVLMVKSKSNFVKKNTEAKSKNFKCFSCGKRGHFANQFKLNSEQKKKHGSSHMCWYQTLFTEIKYTGDHQI